MFKNTLPTLEGQVQSGKIEIALFEFIDDPQGLQVVLEPAVLFHALVQRVS